MLLRYSISNFLSFNKSTEFNLFTGEYRRLDNHVRKFKNLDILKLSAIYGANASGKSNLIKSIAYLKNSVKEGNLIKENFSSFKGNENKSSTFEVEFLDKKRVYIYGIEVLKDEVKKEYLYHSGFDKEDSLLFDREVSKNGESKISIHKKFLTTKKSQVLKEHYEKKVTSNELFLSIVYDVELGKLSKEIETTYNWFWKMQVIFPESYPTYLLHNLLHRPSFLKFTKDMLCHLDTGIKDLHIETFDLKIYFGEDDKKYANEIIEELEKNPESDVVISVDILATLEKGKHLIKKLFVEHIGFGVKNLFSFDEESDGTKRLLEFMSMLYNLIMNDDENINNAVFIIDEIGRSIHPSLLKQFLDKLSKENHIDGQLIFTTHESNLLDLNILRPDEIWFAEKNNNQGNTEFKTLAEFKKIRTDLDVRKGYLNGRFGGIPILANFEDLNWTEYASN